MIQTFNELNLIQNTYLFFLSHLLFIVNFRLSLNVPSFQKYFPKFCILFICISFVSNQIGLLKWSIFFLNLKLIPLQSWPIFSIHFLFFIEIAFFLFSRQKHFTFHSFCGRRACFFVLSSFVLLFQILFNFRCFFHMIFFCLNLYWLFKVIILFISSFKNQLWCKIWFRTANTLLSHSFYYKNKKPIDQKRLDQLDFFQI